jgi:hypothetical protein
MLPPKPANGLDPVGPVRGALEETFDPQRNVEHVDWGASAVELRRLRTLDAIPVVVLTAGLLDLTQALPTSSLQKRAYAIWLDGHERLARLSSNSVHAIAESSAHFIHETQPDVVVTAIRAVVRAARDDARLPSCRALFRRVEDVRCVR